jgi:hypothetical protein
MAPPERDPPLEALVSDQSRSGSSASSADKSGTPDTRSTDQIEAEIEQARERLAGTVDEIAERVKPANIANNAKESAKAQVVDPQTGALRTGRVAAVAGVVAFYVALKVWRVRQDARRSRAGASRRR